MKQTSEKAWVKKELSGFPDGWIHLVTEGYADLDTLRDGKLKYSLTEFKRIHGEIESQIEELGYEPG
jgi:hypothetical protein